MSTPLFAITIAGGRGERLKPLTDSLPKPMVPINGRPLIHHQIERLLKNGVTDVIFLCGYKGETIRGYFGDGSRFGFNAHYSFEDSPLGRGGAVKKGMSLLPEGADVFVVCNGDNIPMQSISSLINRHKERNVTATVMLVPYPSAYGVVETDEADVVLSFAEKARLPYWINAGVYIFSRSIENLLPDKGDHETETFPLLARQRQLGAYKSEALWLTVDSPKDLREVEETLQKAG